MSKKRKRDQDNDDTENNDSFEYEKNGLESPFKKTKCEIVSLSTNTEEPIWSPERYAAAQAINVLTIQLLDDKIKTFVKKYKRKHENETEAKEVVAKLAELLSKCDRHQNYKLFEAISAFKYNLILWENLPCKTLEAKGAFRYNKSIHPDYGIDCASFDLKTTLQAKWYQPGSYVSFRSASTFVLYSKILKCKHKIITTSEKVKFAEVVNMISKLKHQVISNEEMATIILESCTRVRNNVVIHDEQKMPICDMDLSEEKAEKRMVIEDKMENLIDVQVKMKSRLTLRDYQQEAVSKLMECIDKKQKVIRLHMACGGGKTIIASDLIQKIKLKSTNTTIAFMVPSISLLAQAYNVIKKWTPELSIKRVGDGYFLSQNELFDVVICTYQSVDKIAKKKFDLVIVDEGHHLEAHLTDEKKDVKEEKKTERKEKKPPKYNDTDSDESDSDSDSDSDESEVDEKSDDEDDEETKTHGKIARMKTKSFLLMSATLDESLVDDNNSFDFSYPLEKAIEDRHLTDYEVCIPVFKELIKNHNIQDEMAKLIKQNNSTWTKILAYCNSRKSAKKFTKLLKKTYGVKAAYMDGNMKNTKRLKIIKRFETGKLQVLVTVYILGEGVDIPIANTCIFVEPRNSRINLAQCIGRVLRLHSSKQIAHVVLPSTNEEQELARFLRIMSSCDSRLRKSIQEKKPGRINLLFANDENSNDNEETNELLYTKTIENISKMTGKGNWTYTFELVKKYIEINKKLPVRKCIFEGLNIGMWINNQRKNYKLKKYLQTR